MLPDSAKTLSKVVVAEQAFEPACELRSVPAGVDGSSEKTTLTSGKSFFELGARAREGYGWYAESHELLRCRTGCCQAGFRPARPAIEAALPDQHQQRSSDPAGSSSQLVGRRQASAVAVLLQEPFENLKRRLRPYGREQCHRR